MSKLRFVSWTAVSSLPQAEKISLRDQRQRNHDNISHHDGLLVAELQVKESRNIPELSEAAERIEAYAELRKLIRAKAFDVLICYSRSRLGRTLSLIETIAELCRRAKIIIFETDSPPSSLTPPESHDTELLAGAVRSWSSQREIDELRRRHRMGMIGRMNKGEFAAAVPWGWVAEYEKDGTRHIYVDPEAANTIRLVLIDLYLDQGLGANIISEKMNESGRTGPSNRHWTRWVLGDMFRMIYRYAGYAEINKRTKDGTRPYARGQGTWPAIISEDELQKLLYERATRRGNRNQHQTYRFSLILWCSRCQKQMWMQHSQHHHTLLDGTPTTYQSVSARCWVLPRHNKSHISARRALKKVRDFFVYLQDPANWEPYLAATVTDHGAIDQEIDGLEKEIRRAEQKIFNADDKLIDGTLDAERHAHQINRINEDILRLKAEITTLNERKSQVVHQQERQSRLQEIAEHGLSYLDMEDERAANSKLRRLIRVWITDGQVVEIEVL